MPRAKKAVTKTANIEKRIGVTINVGNYSSVTGSCSIREDIEYTTDEELAEKNTTLRERVSNELVEDISYFLDQHGLSEKATIKLNGSGSTKSFDVEEIDDEGDVDEAPVSDSKKDKVEIEADVDSGDDDDGDDEDWFEDDDD
jgi:hypothetical protein